MAYGAPRLRGQLIGDDEWLTHKIKAGEPYIDRPRPIDQGQLSVIRGMVPPEMAYQLVRYGRTDYAETDGARYTQAGILRSKGFVVTHTPTNRIREHVSVTYPSDWDDTVTEMFVSSFVQEQWCSPEGGDSL